MQYAKSLIAQRVLACTLGTLVAVATGEGVVRFFAIAPALKAIEVASPDCVYRRSNNAVLGFELKANYRNPRPDFIQSYESTNSHGQRDLERTIEKPPGTTRILLLGDSVVEGYGLPETDTIARQLQAIYDSAETEVLNFGVSAYCTLAEVELLKTKGIQFSPDQVVLVFVENDFDNFNREAFPLGSAVKRPRWAETLFEHSHLWRLTCLRLNLFAFQAETDPVAWNKQAVGENNVAVGLEQFRELADEHGFQPLIAIWPRFLSDRITDIHFVPERDVLIVEALAAQHRIPSFRMSDNFATAFDAAQRTAGGKSRSPRLLFSQGDQLHPSALGAKVAAEAIHEALSEGVLESQTRFAVDREAIDKAVAAASDDNPNYARVYNRIGNEFLKQGQTEKAMEQYRLALKQDPENSATHNNLGIALERAGKAGAVQHYRKAVQLQPDFAEAHCNLGNALDESDRKQAQQYFIKAIQTRPDFVAAHFSMSRSLLREKRMRAAEMGFREVLKLDPSHLDSLRMLARMLAETKRYQEARTFFERLVSLDPEDAEVLNNLGAICAALGDKTAAIEYLKAAVAVDPKHPRAGENLSNLLNP